MSEQGWDTCLFILQKNKKRGDNKILTGYGKMTGKQDDKKPKGR